MPDDYYLNSPSGCRGDQDDVRSVAKQYVTVTGAIGRRRSQVIEAQPGHRHRAVVIYESGNPGLNSSPAIVGRVRVRKPRPQSEVRVRAGRSSGGRGRSNRYSRRLNQMVSTE